MITKAPIYLDDTSLLDKRQIRKINSMIKSQINLFTSKAVQETKKDEVGNSVTGRSSEILELTEYTYDGMFFVSLSVIPQQTLSLIRIADVDTYEYTGYFDENLTLPLSDYGVVSYADGTFTLNLESLPDSTTLYLNIKGNLK